MNSIATIQNNVNITPSGHKNGLLFQDINEEISFFTGKPSIEAQNGGLFPYLDTNAQVGEDFKGSLGIYTKSCTEIEEKKHENNVKRSKKQQLASELLDGRVSLCERVPIMMVPENGGARIPDSLRVINIMKRGESFSFGGLMHCGSVWNCPVCASIITEFRRQELKQAHISAVAMGLSISLLTLTVPHYANDSLEDVLEKITKALRKLKNYRAFKKITEGIGLVGDIRSLEVTYGVNGWHPHFHLLQFTRSELNDQEINSLSKILLSLWQKACVSSGLPCPNDHGLDLVNGTWASAYVSKWGMEEEMTKGHLKQGVKEGHVSPFGLLDQYAEGDKNAGRKFQEFSKVFKGKRQLVWSKGLRELLQVGNKIPDDQIIIEQERKSEVFMQISYEDYKKLLRYEKRFECRKLCAQGEEAVRAFIDDLYHRDVSFSPPYQ